MAARRPCNFVSDSKKVPTIDGTDVAGRSAVDQRGVENASVAMAWGGGDGVGGAGVGPAG